MGFVKRQRILADELPGEPVLDQQALLIQLADADSLIRRAAIRGLANDPENAIILINFLSTETDLSVQEAIFNALITINTETVVTGLLPFLSSENAALRNAAIEALQLMPDMVAPYMENLLSDADSDVRIMALDILQILRHPNAQDWLRKVVEQDAHVNVCATAVDRLSEIGTVEIIPALQALAQRFNHEPFMRFAIQTAIDRIEGSSSLRGANAIT